MHPELLNNAIFLRYYELWQEDPTSIVFAAIAEYLIGYQLYDQAIEICQRGLKSNPELVSGRLALAKAFFRKKEYPQAREILKNLLQQYPEQEKGLELWHLLKEEKKPETAAEKSREKAGWQTVTMAKIFAAQGHKEKAREVYQHILKQDPQNREAQEGLKALEG